MKIAVVGAGFSGLGMAAALRDAGHEDFVILERAGDVGGVWRENTYPGAACDVPSYLYSYSWAQRRDWSQPCSPQAEIHDYLRDVALDRGLTHHLRFGAEVEQATWDAGTLQWELQLSSGDAMTVDVLILACGQLSRPAWPAIDGLDTFAGTSFHSAEWDHDHDLRGERVAVIGTGASAIQFVPPVAEEAGHVDIYQRTAPYMLPRRNPRYPAVVKGLIRHVPGVQATRRLSMWMVMESFIFGLTKAPVAGAGLRLWSTSFMRLQLRDAELRERIWPDYAFGCKRILFSSYYLKALQRENVEVVTDPITQITPRGIVTADGVEREVDTIIYGTGFRAGEFVLPMAIRGVDGTELQETWSDGPEAHLGMTVSGYPNMFLLYGPNTNLGVGSIVAMIESQARYVTSALALLQAAPGTALDVLPEVQERSGRALQERLAESVWTQCSSWYRQGGTGKIIGNWPGFMTEYARATRRADPQEFAVVSPEPVPATTA